MAKRRRSLLDAFRASDPSKGPAAAAPPSHQPLPRAPAPPPRAAPQPQPIGAPAPIASKPAPVVAPRPEPQAPPSVVRPTPPTASPAAPRDRIVLVALGAVTVLALVAWWVRGSKTNDTQAAGDGSSTASVAPSTAPSTAPTAPVEAKSVAATPPAGATDQDRAFYDRANRFTIRLAQYDNDETGKKLARDLYKYLQVEGVPVVLPIESGDRRFIIVCADAKPAKDELAAVHNYVKGLRGPSGTKSKKLPFADAWIDNIDHVLKRP
jgi:hypothetical protein